MPQLQIIAPDPNAHRPAVKAAFAEGWSPEARRRWFQNCRFYYDLSPYDWQSTRIGIMDGTVVTHFGVWQERLRIGSARVKVGGIGAVSTHPDYRKRGLMRQTAQAAIEAMAANGYDLSLLFGIRNFYHRFGYVRAWAAVVYRVHCDAMPSNLPAPTTTRTALRADPDVVSLYNRQYARATGTAVRPTFSFTPAFPRWFGGFG